ncbi:hypothetical protein N0V82_009913 [Gnomoniopsis sp. IMI 355080]|nr:hypothetical protein N0V82_009913 [Gnomoniopsis sp. IMI 355080]
MCAHILQMSEPHDSGVLLPAAVLLMLTVIAFRLLATSQNHASDTQGTRLYGLDHGRLNITAKPTTMWMNIGFWKDTADFPTACQNLLIETLRHAGLVERVAVGRGTSTVKAASGVNILDLGFGCGDQTCCLAGIWQNAAFRYVGLTLSHVQYVVALKRLAGSTKGGASTIKMHCADAARPEAWSEDIMTDVLSLKSQTQAQNMSGEAKNAPIVAGPTWVLALDTLYHFTPSRLPILSFAARELNASLMAFDLLRSDTTSLRQQLLLSLVFRLSGCPRGALVTEGQYREMLAQAGYDPAQTKIVDVTEHTFQPLSNFMEKQEIDLRLIGLSLGKLKLAQRLFAWFAREHVVKAVIAVAHPKRAS